MKPLDPADIAVAHTGGVPAAAVVLLVGYGSPCINVMQFEDRMVLNNGFHRAYVLRALGHKRIPVAVQHVENADLEFPQVVAGLPREYLLKHRRPVVMKDFFDRSYYGALGRIEGRPYALLVCAGSDGSNAVRQVERIATGWRLRKVAQSRIVCTHAQTPEAIQAPKQITAADLLACEEAGEALGSGLVMGVF